MAIILGSVTLGDSDGNNNNNSFIQVDGVRTRVWAGGLTTIQPDSFEVSADSDNPSYVVARDCSIICTNPFADAGTTSRRNYGTTEWTNVKFDIFQGSFFTGTLNRTDSIWNNVTVTSSQSATQNVWGWYGIDTNASEPNVSMNWNNVNLYFDTGANNISVTTRCFIGTITPDSTLNNIRFWNGLTGDDTKGARPEFGSVTILNNLLVGPVAVPDTATIFSFFRYSNSGGNINGAAASPFNHWGCNANLDYRNVNQFNVAGSQVTLKFDNNSHVAFINPLQGVPAASANFGYNNEYNTTSNDPRAHMFVATNPVFGEGDHRVAVDDSELNTSAGRGLYVPDSEGWELAVDFSVDSDVVFYNDSEDRNYINYPGYGLFFRDSQFRQRGVSGQHQVLAPIKTIATKPYRVYSWATDNWGTAVTVQVPPINAADSEVATARAGGFDIFNGRRWETSTTIANSLDPVTSQSAINTFAKADSELLGLTDTQDITTATVQRAINTSSYIPATSKALRWAAMSIADNNAVFPLGYTITGTSVRYTAPLNFNDSDVSSWNTDTNQLHSFSCSSLAQDSLITEVSSSQLIRFRGANLGYESTSTKVDFRSDVAIELDSDIPATTYRNFTFKSPIIRGVRLADTFDNLTIIADSDYAGYQVDIDPGNILNTTFDNLFGTNPVLQIHHDRPVTLNSSSTLSIVIEDSDTFDLFVAGNNVTFLRNFVTQSTRLRIDVTGIAIGSRIVFYRGLTADSEIVATRERTDDIEEIIISSDSESDLVIHDSEIGLDNEHSFYTIGVSNRNYQTMFYPIEVQRNTATTDADQVDYSYILAGQTDQTSVIEQTPAPAGKSFVIRDFDLTDSELTVINAYRTARGATLLTNNNQTVIEVNGCDIPDFGSVSEVSYMAASVRTDSEYLNAMRRKVGPLTIADSGSFNAGVRPGNSIGYDIFQFVQEGVNVLPEGFVLFSDTTDSDSQAYQGQEFSIQAIQGMYKTQNQNFQIFGSLEQSLDLGTLRQDGPSHEPHVIAYPRDVASNDEILIATAADLDDRLLTRRNMINIGALTPILDSDGSLAVSPYFSQ